MSARQMVRDLRDSGVLGLPQRSLIADNALLLVPLALAFGAIAVLGVIYLGPNLPDVATFVGEKKPPVVYAKPGDGRGSLTPS